MIKLMVFDVDGTLTDGSINISPTGELFKRFNVKDGYGIAVLLKEHGVIPAIITGRQSEIVSYRCKELKIDHVYQNVSNKKQKLLELIDKLNISLDQTAYMGDDLNDHECFTMVKYPACPNHAIELIKKSAFYVCTKNAGEGAVREYIDYLIESSLI